MEIIIIILIGLVIYVLIKPSKPESNFGNEPKEEISEEALHARVSDAVELQDLMSEYILFVEKHANTLYEKEKQLVYKNDYGVEDTSGYDREIDYFIANVVPLRFKEKIPISSMKMLINGPVRRVRGKQIRKDKESLEPLIYDANMSGQDFEKLIKQRFESLGFATKLTPVTGDQGIDLILEKEEKLIVVQCKRSATAIGNKAVQEAAAGKNHYSADEAWVVSDAEYTKSARQLAKTNSVKLINYFSLSVE